jgi:hypothetical protein
MEGLMSDPISNKSISAIRTLFFERLARNNRELIETHNEIALEINNQNHNGLLALLDETERRVKVMHTILIVLRECLEG